MIREWINFSDRITNPCLLFLTFPHTGLFWTDIDIEGQYLKTAYCILLLILFLAGGILIKISSAYPLYYEYGNTRPQIHTAEGDIDGWNKALNQYKTPHIPMNNIGRGLIALSGTLSLLLLLSGFPLPDSKTPSSKRSFMGLYVCMILVYVFLSCLYFYRLHSRFEYPVWHDSLYRQMIITVLKGTLMLAVIPFWKRIFTAWKPSELYAQRKASTKNLLLSGITFTVILCCLYLCGKAVYAGQEGTIILCMGLSYLMLSGRNLKSND